MSKTSDFSLVLIIYYQNDMTPQEFFKKDSFAEKTGVELIEIKRRIQQSPSGNYGNTSQCRKSHPRRSTLYTGRPRPGSGSHSHGTLAFSLSSNITFLRSSGPGDILYAEARERYIGRTTGHYQIDITNQNGELVATFESSIFRKGDALPFTL